MEITKGMKVRQTKTVPAYGNSGFYYPNAEFVVDDIKDDIVICKSIKSGVGFGLTTKDFFDYFEVVKEKEVIDISSCSTGELLTELTKRKDIKSSYFYADEKTIVYTLTRKV